MERKENNLTNRPQCGKIGVDAGAMRWIRCPACTNAKLVQVYPETKARRMPVYCKQCRNYVEVNID